LDLCDRLDRRSIAYRRVGGHRLSIMLDRLMWGLNRPFDLGQHLHGSREARRSHCRAWAWSRNFAPRYPAAIRENKRWRCPAEHLNRHRYHDCWLKDPLISASLCGFRCRTPKISGGQRIDSDRGWPTTRAVNPRRSMKAVDSGGGFVRWTIPDSAVFLFRKYRKYRTTSASEASPGTTTDR